MLTTHAQFSARRAMIASTFRTAVFTLRRLSSFQHFVSSSLALVRGDVCTWPGLFDDHEPLDLAKLMLGGLIRAFGPFS